MSSSGSYESSKISKPHTPASESELKEREMCCSDRPARSVVCGREEHCGHSEYRALHVWILAFVQPIDED